MPLFSSYLHQIVIFNNTHFHWFERLFIIQTKRQIEIKLKSYDKQCEISFFQFFSFAVGLKQSLDLSFQNHFQI